MPPQRPPKDGPSQPNPVPDAPGRSPGGRHLPNRPPLPPHAAVDATGQPQAGGQDLNIGVAVAADASGGAVTARRAGGLRDTALPVDPDEVGLKAALQNLAKGVNVAFQTDYGENFLEAVYQAAIVRHGEIHIVHKEYFGFGNTWFGQFGMLLRSMRLTLDGPDPASPEGQARIIAHGPSTIRGILNLVGRKLDLVAEYEDRVPAYVEQMFDRLEASGIIVGWDRDQWDIWTTKIGLNIRIRPRKPEEG